MAIFLSARPLRESRPFALLWLAGTLTSVSSQMVLAASAWEIYDRSGSSLAVGGLGLAVGIPTVIAGLAGGVLADTRRPRRVGIVGVLGQLCSAFLLVIVALQGALSPQHLYVLIAVQATFAALTAPSRRPYVRTLLADSAIPAAMGLSLLSMQLGLIFGPVLSGLFLDGGAIAAIFGIHAASLVLYLLSVVSLPEITPAAKAETGLKATKAGIVAAWGLPRIRTALLIDFSATFFALPVALLPQLTAENLDGSATTYGLLLASVSVGGVVGTILSGVYAEGRFPLRVMALAASIWCAATVVLAYLTSIAPVIAVLFLSGILDSVLVIVRQTIIQREAPTAMLGRVSSVQSVVAVAGPQLGNFRAGAFGSILGTQLALAVGAGLGLASVWAAHFSATNYARSSGE